MIKFHTYKKYQMDRDQIIDFTLDIPSKRYDSATEPFGFLGWVVGNKIKIEKIEIVANGFHILSLPVELSRPELFAKYPGNPAGDKLGFFKYMNPYCLPENFIIDVFAVAANCSRIQLFQIEGTRKAFSKPFYFDINPLIINSLGRTGSTYLLALLGMHPEVVTYKPYEAEARYVSYWVQMFLNLGNPQTWMCPLVAYDRSSSDWIYGNSHERPFHYGIYPEIIGWAFNDYLKDSYVFIMQSLQGHYQKVAALEKKKDPKFLCEKFIPDYFTERVIELIPSSKEVILVRDFRDMLCSIRAFNAKRGYYAFGREKFSSDAEYIAKGLKNGTQKLLWAWEKRKKSACLIKYEDLVLSPESTLKGLFEFLGVDASPSTVQKVIKTANRIEYKRQKAHTTSKNQQSSIGRYHTELDPDLLELCNEAFSESLKGFGYL